MFYATLASVSKADIASDVVQTEETNQSLARSMAVLASSTAASRASLESLFVPSDEVVMFIKTLESIGSRSGSVVSIASIDSDPLTDKPVGTIGAVRAHVDIHGPWTSVMRALSLTERLPFDVSIDHVQLDVSSTALKANRVWNLSFDIQAAMIVASPSSTSSI
jgi:hypothetical protein